jgi:cytochrome P450
MSARSWDCTTALLLSTIFQLIVAGHDTTTSLLGNSVVALSRNPAQLAQLRADPSKLRAVVEEFLRYDAPVPHSTFRYATEPAQMGEAVIPRGSGHHLPGRHQPGR